MMMLSRDLLQVLLAISSLSVTTTFVSATPYHDSNTHLHRRHLHPRNYVSPEQRLDSYDFIIAGGGLAGLILASRLSENSSTTVLVLEAGPSGDAVSSRINTPGQTYYNSLLGAAPYDWLYKTSSQPNAGGREMSQPRGKLLGGSSAINGMYLVRPPAEQVNAWQNLIAPNDATAATTWGWDSVYAAMKKTEAFSPPVDAAESTAGIKYTASSHGTSGPIHATYPAYMVPVTGDWLPTLANAGVSVSEDAYSGNNIGGFFATTAINPANWTRSYSRSGYIDILPPRNNLHVMFDATVERITFSDNVVGGNIVASGIQFSTGKGTAVQSVTANKEVILAGGAYGSAHILQVSGVGPKDVLTAANVPVKLELPGVGEHLIDHLAAGVVFKSNVDTQGTIMASGSDFSKSPEFGSFVNSGIAYINGSLLFGGDASYATFVKGIQDSSTAANTLAPGKDSTVVAGYKAIYDESLKSNYPTTGLIEILLSINSANQIAIQAAIQQPLSQGRMYITSPSIYDNPVIDPQYLSNPADITIFRQGIKLARQIAAAAPLSNSLGDEVTPGPNVQSDQDIENWLRTAANTEYHPSGACGMLPLSQGGVVDAKLKVYGTANVRVIDSSVIPVSMSAHLMAPTYALAEMGAAIIEAQYAPSTSTATATSGSNNGSSANGSSGSPSTDSSGSKTTGKTNSAIGYLRVSWLAMAAPFVLAFAL